MKLTTNSLSSAAMTLMMLLAATSQAAATTTDAKPSAAPAVNMQSALLIKQVSPVYPPMAKQARIQGTVKFNATISEDGSVTNIRPVEGHPALISAAMDAVK